MQSHSIGSESTCVEPFYANGDTLSLMFAHGRLPRIAANNQGMHTHTAQNIGVDATDGEVRAVHINITQRPSKYNGPPAHDLIVWTEANRACFLFEIDAENEITAIHAGGPSILHVEGCA